MAGGNEEPKPVPGEAIPWNPGDFDVRPLVVGHW